MKKFLPLCAALIMGLSAHTTAQANTAANFPEKAVNIVVPFAAGGGSDTLARTIGQHLSDMWSQPVIVVNKAGADGNIGANFVATSEADGYTLMVLDIGTLTMGSIFYKDLPFNADEAFDPV